jgi:hypothetical protein
MSWHGFAWETAAVAGTLVNVGLGPALRLLLRVTYTDEADSPSWEYNYAAISPGSEVEITIRTRFESAIDLDPMLSTCEAASLTGTSERPTRSSTGTGKKLIRETDCPAADRFPAARRERNPPAGVWSDSTT